MNKQKKLEPFFPAPPPPGANSVKAKLEAQLAQARSALQQNRPEQAIRLGRALLKQAPDALVVMDLLCQAYTQAQRPEDALPLLRTMSRLEPDNAQVWFNLGTLQLQLRHPFDAKASLLRALQLNPAHHQARNSLGVLFMNMGQDELAERTFGEILEQQPTDYYAHRNLAALMVKLKRADEAINYYERALSIANTGRARYELADALFKQDPSRHGQRIEELLTASLQAEPQSEVLIDLLARFHAANQAPEKAEALFQRGMQLPVVSGALQLHYADFLASEKRHLEADALYRQIARREPKNPIPYINGANNLEKQGDLLAALQFAQLGLKKDVTHPGPLRLTEGNLLRRSGDLSAAEACYRQGMLSAPAGQTLYSNLWYLLDGQCANPSADEAAQNERLDYGVMMSWRGLFDRIKHDRTAPHAGPLRIGLVSADLRDHVVGHFLRGILRALHQRHGHRLQVHAFASDEAKDAIAREIQALCASWHNIKALDDLQAARLITEQRIDILIDLSGHTAGTRLPLFAFRPAPVQVSWLGYFATTGLFEMDYLLTDPWSLPEDHAQYFTETLWPLPRTRLCYTEPDLPVQSTPLPALTNGHITFGCFNQSVKLTPETLDAWGQILRQVPGSRLFLKNAALISSAYRQQLSAHFARYGIEASRLIFEARSTHEEYLRCFSRVDIALDPFPYTGGGTTVDNLRSGVPVLTRYGTSLISRQSYGMLMSVGLSDWVAPDWPQYIDHAVQWANNLPALAQLRAELRSRTLQSPLFDAEGMADDLAAAFEAMWARWRSGEQPDAEQKFRSALRLRYQIGSHSQAPVWIIAATQKTEAEFWEHSALGQSLRLLMPLDPRLQPCITYANRRGLPEIYNAAIDAASADAVLVFMHDDVYLDHLTGLTAALDQGLQHFQVVGVAGNRRRLTHQPSWGFINRHLHQDEARYLSGGIGHGKTPGQAVWSHFGPTPAACELLDGVFLATTKAALQSKGVRFDPRFQFHFYDLDFCRSARQAGLSLGTWPIRLTHQSGGNYFSDDWLAQSAHYFEKWKH